MLEEQKTTQVIFIDTSIVRAFDLTLGHCLIKVVQQYIIMKY